MGGNSDSLFHINMTSGELTFLSPLDRETQDTHTLTVTAFDAGSNPISSQSAETTILILVEDVNDNPPVFEEDSYSVSVAENQPVGTSLLTLRAMDRDTGQNAEISYQLATDSPTSDFFQLDSSTGELLTASLLDFEAAESYMLTVMASDGGFPSLSAAVEVRVAVTDQNDVRPTFQETSYTVELREDVAMATSVLQLVADDADTDVITYAIVAGNSYLH